MIKELSILDAFKALSEIDDEKVMSKNDKHFLNENKNNKKALKEGVIFNAANKEDMANAEKLLAASDVKEDTELTVIDPNTDSLNHIADKKDYIGQTILQCKACKNKIFVDPKDIEKDANDPTSYNPNTECPTCHATGIGYDIIGQVGNNNPQPSDVKVEKEPTTELPDEVKFSKEETAQELPKEEPAKEEPTLPTAAEVGSSEGSVDVKDDKEPLPWDETDSKEDDEESTLGNVKDLDDVKYDDTEEKPEEEVPSKLGKSYSTEDEKKEDKKEDDKANESLNEDLNIKTVRELFGLCIDPETIEEVNIIRDKDISAAEDKDDVKDAPIIGVEWATIFKGKFEDLPANLLDAKILGFDGDEASLIIRTTDSKEESLLTVNDFLKDFIGTSISILDENDNELFNGDPADTPDSIGMKKFKLFEHPTIMNIHVENVEEIKEAKIVEEVVELDPTDNLSGLIENVIKANKLDIHNVNKVTTEEYWLAEDLRNAEELDIFYNRYIFPIHSVELTEQFKKVMNYKTDLDIVNEKYNIEEEYTENVANNHWDELVNELDKRGIKYKLIDNPNQVYDDECLELIYIDDREMFGLFKYNNIKGASKFDICAGEDLVSISTDGRFNAAKVVDKYLPKSINEKSNLKEEKQFLNEIKVDTLKNFIERIKKEFPGLVKDTQEQLDKSENKSTDYAILSVFYSKLFGKVTDGIWATEDVGKLFGDEEAMNPMPESVGKQLLSNLFTIKHLKPLYDLGIYDGFTLIQEFEDNPTIELYKTFYDDCVKYGNELFGNKLNEDKNSSIKTKIEKIIKDYLNTSGYESDDEKYFVVEVSDFTSEDGDKAIHVQIRNDLLDFYDCEDLIDALDKVVKPGYFEPYDSTTWDAYIWKDEIREALKEDVEEAKKNFKNMVQNIESERIKDELKARPDYMNDAKAIEDAGKDLPCDCAKKIAEVSKDLAKEENVHVGELEKVIDKVTKGDFLKNIESGHEEAGEKLESGESGESGLNEEKVVDHIFEGLESGCESGCCESGCNCESGCESGCCESGITEDLNDPDARCNGCGKLSKISDLVMDGGKLLCLDCERHIHEKLNESGIIESGIESGKCESGESGLPQIDELIVLEAKKKSLAKALKNIRDDAKEKAKTGLNETVFSKLLDKIKKKEHPTMPEIERVVYSEYDGELPKGEIEGSTFRGLKTEQAGRGLANFIEKIFPKIFCKVFTDKMYNDFGVNCDGVDPNTSHTLALENLEEEESLKWFTVPGGFIKAKDEFDAIDKAYENDEIASRMMEIDRLNGDGASTDYIEEVDEKDVPEEIRNLTEEKQFLNEAKSNKWFACLNHDDEESLMIITKEDYTDYFDYVEEIEPIKEGKQTLISNDGESVGILVQNASPNEFTNFLKDLYKSIINKTTLNTSLNVDKDYFIDVSADWIENAADYDLVINNENQFVKVWKDFIKNSYVDDDSSAQIRWYNREDVADELYEDLTIQKFLKEEAEEEEKFQGPFKLLVQYKDDDEASYYDEYETIEEAREEAENNEDFVHYQIYDFEGDIIEEDDWMDEDAEEEEIDVEDCINFLNGDEEAGYILYGWLEAEDALLDDKDEVLNRDNVLDLCEFADDLEDKKIVLKAMGEDIDDAE